jgi:hypothetical protein
MLVRKQTDVLTIHIGGSQRATFLILLNLFILSCTNKIEVSVSNGRVQQDNNCDPQGTAGQTSPACDEFSLEDTDKVILAKAGDKVLFYGKNFRPTMTLASAQNVEGNLADFRIAVESNTLATLSIPNSIPLGTVQVILKQDGVSRTLMLMNVGEDAPSQREPNSSKIYTGGADSVCQGIGFYDAKGRLQKGSRVCHNEESGDVSIPDCKGNLDFDCRTSEMRRSVDLAGFTVFDMLNGTEISSIRGKLTLSPPKCLRDGDLECLVELPFRSAESALIIPGNIKNNAEVGGVRGSYPSPSSPLEGNTSIPDLTTFGSLTPVGTYEFFDRAGNVHSATVADTPTIGPMRTPQTLSSSTILYRQVVVEGDPALVSSNIKLGATIFGVAGTVVPSPEDCSTNGSQNCVAMGSFYAARPCTDNGSNCFLPSYQFSQQPLKAIDYDEINAARGSIRSNLTLGGINGALADCSLDGEIQCYTAFPFKAVQMTRMIPGNIRNNTNLGGITGSYPSLSNPLSGSSAISDLTSFGSGTAPGSYEFFDSAGGIHYGEVQDAGPVVPGAEPKTVSQGSTFYRQIIIAGDSNLSSANILSGRSIFGVSGLMVASPADCSDGTQQNCVARSTFRAALTCRENESACFLPIYTGSIQPLKALNFDAIEAGQGAFRTDVTLAGIVGTLSDCSYDGQTGCVVTSGFKSVAMASATPANIRAGITIAGILGTYPSLSTPLLGTTTLPDLTSFNATTPVGTYQFFDSVGNVYNGSVADLVVSTPTTETQFLSDNSTLYRRVTLLGDSQLQPTNIKSGTSIFGIIGITETAPGICNTSGSQNCVASGSFYAARVCSANGSQCYLPPYVPTIQSLKAIHYDSIFSGRDQFLTSLSIAGVSGTLGDCLSDGESGCMSVAPFPAIDASEFSSAYVRNSIQLGGVVGSYPSATAPLSGASQIEDLTSFGSATPPGAYEFFDSAGNVYSGNVADLENITPTTTNQVLAHSSTLYRQIDLAGDTNFISGNIKLGTQIFGVTGAVPPKPSDCAEDGSQNCIAKGAYFAATECQGNASNCFIYPYIPQNQPLKAINVSTIEAGKASMGANLTFGGITGTISTCTNDGATGCIASGDFRALDVTRLTEGVLKNGVSVLGITGRYPSDQYRLEGASSAASLPNFIATMPGSSY